MEMPEPESILTFRAWLVENGAHVNPDVRFEPVTSGFNVVATNEVPADTTIVSIPFALAITPELSKEALTGLLGAGKDAFAGWSERQLECTYVCMHWVADRDSSRTLLKHGRYIDTLPAPEKLCTPLHFAPAELQAFQGSNLYGAALERRQAWEVEWHQCRAAIGSAKPVWGAEFTWDRYLTASTYLSSRAFPSTLLSPTPSLVATATSHPVLLPGIDALNHARAHPVSWVVSSSSPSASFTSSETVQQQSISLVIHASTPRGAELLNNYGPKPNSELILGYGFSLPNNPDDTIVLKIGGNLGPASSSSASSSSSTAQAPLGTGRWEVGRRARGAEPVWEAVLAATQADVPSDGDEDELDQELPVSEAENELFAAQTLADMVQHLHDRLPPFPPSDAAHMRPEVLRMLEHYLEGQRDILKALVTFAQDKEARAVVLLRELGLDIVDEVEEEGE
ncbi:SET domain-containing protein [Daedaleopsis nitida]|nr:SET domain-containing protein [Daedaleopsis nitida]